MEKSGGRHVRATAGNNKTTLTDQLYLSLRDDILSWRLTPSDILVESKLAKQYNVSKTPVREALALLSQEGWVEVLPRVGYRVTPIRVSDVDELFEMRLMAEKEAIRLVVLRADNAQLETLLAESSQSRGICGDDLAEPELFIRHHDPLHLNLARLAANRRLERLIHQLLRDWTRMCLSDAEVREKAFVGEKDNCRQICEALIRRDVDSAHALIHAHIMYSKKLILSGMTLGNG
ncbi:GntR family transcriptional regulator [Candidatus Bipolaricaulota bacterium]|nr:GntR family transcriptional regulator [Candidatus Bipolaricaulota bacterium]